MERSWCRPRRPRPSLLDIAEDAEVEHGVVGWTDFDGVDGVARIEALAARNLLVGLRPMGQDIADDDWLLSPALAPRWRQWPATAWCLTRWCCRAICRHSCA